jgi:uncharacterized protein (TIRG00374 family)
VLPFRLDEIARIFYLGHRSGIARSAVLGTIVVERIIDATMLLLSVGVLTVLIGNNEWLAKGGRIVALALVVAMLLVAMVLVARRPLSKIVMRFSSARFGRAVDGALQNLALGLKAFPRGRRLLVVVTYAAGEWLVTLLHMRAVLAAFDIGIPAAGVIGLVTAVYLSFALPSGPGAIGLFELLVKGSLVVGFAIDPSKALGFALTLHVVLITPISLYGAICMAREGWALSRLMNASHREAHDELR